MNLLYIGNNEFIKFAGNIPFISANFNEILFNSSDSIIFVQGNLFDRYNEKHPTIKDFIVLLGNYYTDTNSSNNISTFIQKIKFPSKMH